MLLKPEKYQSIQPDLDYSSVLLRKRNLLTSLTDEITNSRQSFELEKQEREKEIENKLQKQLKKSDEIDINIKSQTEKLNSIQANISATLANLGSLPQDKGRLKQEVEQLEKKLNTVKTEFEDENAKLSGLKGQLKEAENNKIRWDEDKKNREKEMTDYNNKITKKEGEFEKIVSDINAVEEQKSKLNKELESIQQQVVEMDDLKTVLEKEFGSKLKFLDDKRIRKELTKLTENNKLIEEKDSRIESLTDELNQLKEKAKIPEPEIDEIPEEQLPVNRAKSGLFTQIKSFLKIGNTEKNIILKEKESEISKNKIKELEGTGSKPKQSNDKIKKKGEGKTETLEPELREPPTESLPKNGTESSLIAQIKSFFFKGRKLTILIPLLLLFLCGYFFLKPVNPTTNVSENEMSEKGESIKEKDKKNSESNQKTEAIENEVNSSLTKTTTTSSTEESDKCTGALAYLESVKNKKNYYKHEEMNPHFNCIKENYNASNSYYQEFNAVYNNWLGLGYPREYLKKYHTKPNNDELLFSFAQRVLSENEVENNQINMTISKYSELIDDWNTNDVKDGTIKRYNSKILYYLPQKEYLREFTINY